MLQWLYDMLGWKTTPPITAKSRIKHFESLIQKHKTVDPMIEIEKSFEIIGRPLNLESHQELNHFLSTQLEKKMADLALPKIPEVQETVPSPKKPKSTAHLRPANLTENHHDKLQQALSQLKFSHFKQKPSEDAEEIKERDEIEEKDYISELTESNHIVPMAPPL